MKFRPLDAYVSIAKARNYANSTKGVPVPGTGRTACSGYCCHSSSGKSGVMGGSRILAHRYMDELDNGRWHRREIRRKERALWMAEAIAEMEEEFSSLMDEPDF